MLIKFNGLDIDPTKVGAVGKVDCVSGNFNTLETIEGFVIFIEGNEVIFRSSRKTNESDLDYTDRINQKRNQFVELINKHTSIAPLPLSHRTIL